MSDDDPNFPRSLIGLQGDMGCTRASREVNIYFHEQCDIFKYIYSGDVYFRTLHGFLIQWRVAGEFADFDGGCGPERLRRPAKSNWLIIDLVIPKSWWQSRSDGEKRLNIALGTRACFAMMYARCKKEKELKDEWRLIQDFERAMHLFETDMYAPKPPQE